MSPTPNPVESLPQPSREPNALRHVPSHARLWIAAIGGLVFDLWSKDWAFRTLEFDKPRLVLEHVCSLQLSLNPGALFGLGAGWAPLFVGASVLALMFVLYLFASSSRRRWSLHLALGLVLAGAIGNLYDRTTQTAFVVHRANYPRDVGMLVDETATHVTICDYGKPGTNPRNHAKPLDPRSGPQPVVRDFIKIELSAGGYSLWPWIFNVADALLVVGVGMLLLNFWLDRKLERSAEPSANV